MVNRITACVWQRHRTVRRAPGDGRPFTAVLFPNENHWVLSPQNSIYWNYEVQQWLARHIGGHPMAKPEFGDIAKF